MMTSNQRKASRATFGLGLTWGLPVDIDHRHFTKLLHLLDFEGGGTRKDRDGAAVAQALRAWLAATGTPSAAQQSLEALAWCHALPGLADIEPEETLSALRKRLISLTTEAVALPTDEAPWIHQVLAGELPLTLALLSPGDKKIEKLVPAGRRVLSEGLIELLDENGLPRAVHLDQLRPLLACWTRVRAMRDKLRGGCWSKEAEIQYQWLVRAALRLARHDGKHVFSNGAPSGNDAALFEAALKLGGDSEDRRIAATVLPQAKKAPAKGKPVARPLPTASANSEWAATSLLRADWSPGAPRLTVAWTGSSCRMELARQKDILLTGTWEPDVRLDGQRLRPTGDWEQTCWSSDEDVDYVELELQLSEDVSIQRHILLARQDRFALLADAVLGQYCGKIEYRGAWSLGPDVRFRSAKNSREGLLGAKGAKPIAALPLALGEWREDGRPGSLAEAAGKLELVQSAEGCRMFAPLWIDMDQKRIGRPLTWRQLTVGETLQAVAGDVAVGYRVTVGKQTWLIYRSLGQRGNRTLLGHNISREMFVGRVDRNGEVAPLIEIE